MKLLLFDIDGTLLRSRGLGRRALERAIDDCRGWPAATSGVSFGGMTDPLIVEAVYAHHGRDPEEARRDWPRIRERYVAHLERAAAEESSACAALPGVAALLERLGAHPGCVVGLLTGNVEQGARVKLRAAGLGGVEFAVGAFGDEAPRRSDLLPVALARLRAARPALDLGPERAVVIGDTPLDIGVARAHGARAVAVATGHSPRAELEAHAPDVLLDSLADLEAATEALLA